MPMSAIQSSASKRKIHLGNLTQGFRLAEARSEGSSLAIVGDRSCDKANYPAGEAEKFTEISVYGVRSSCKPSKLRGVGQFPATRHVGSYLPRKWL
jgi:hypothetical protein